MEETGKKEDIGRTTKDQGGTSAKQFYKCGGDEIQHSEGGINDGQAEGYYELGPIMRKVDFRWGFMIFKIIHWKSWNIA
jgi:antitoxin component YwqK of YwqJK toxin-antitoxin module